MGEVRPPPRAWTWFGRLGSPLRGGSEYVSFPEAASFLIGKLESLEGKPAEVQDNFNNSLQHLEQSAEIYAAPESQTALATGLRTYLARNRRIRAVTCALLQEI
jgi:hypothetical protein